MKGFRPKDDPGDPPEGRNGTRGFHGERRANDSHASTTDRDARPYRKGPGQEAKLSFVGHVLMENRHGLVVDPELTRASDHAERLAALAMLDRCCARHSAMFANIEQNHLSHHDSLFVNSQILGTLSNTEYLRKC